MAWKLFGLWNNDTEAPSIAPKPNASQPAEPNGLKLKGFHFALYGSNFPQLILANHIEVLASIFEDHPDPEVPKRHLAPTGDKSHGTLIQGFPSTTVFIALFHQAYGGSENTYIYDKVHEEWINPQKWIDKQKNIDFKQYYQEEYGRISPKMLIDAFFTEHQEPAFSFNNTFSDNPIVWNPRYSPDWQEETRGKLAEVAANKRIAHTNWEQRFEQVEGEKPIEPEIKNFICCEFVMYLRIYQSGGRPAWETKVVRRSELTQEAYEDGKGKAYLKWIAETPTLLKQMWDKPLVNEIKRQYTGAELAPQFIPSDDVVTGSLAMVLPPDRNPTAAEVFAAAKKLPSIEQVKLARLLFETVTSRNPKNESGDQAAKPILRAVS